MSQVLKVKCPGCDQTIKAGEKYWGKKVKCPGCAKTLSIPSPKAKKTTPQKKPRPAAPQAKPKRSAPKPPAAPVDDLGDWDDDDEISSNDFLDDDFSDNMMPTRPAPRKKKRRVEVEEEPEPRRRKRRPRNRNSGMESGSVLAGIGMMVGATIWFFVGLFAMDRIFFYPPVLFVFGGISFVKGLMGE